MKNNAEKKQEEIEIWECRGGVAKRIGVCGKSGVVLIKEILADSPGLPHGNAKQVRVIDVDEAEFGEWVSPGSGGIKPVYKEQVFESATIASKHLGFQHNEVGQRLSHARSKAEKEALLRYGRGHKIRLRPEAKIRGVTLQYEDDVKDL